MMTISFTAASRHWGERRVADLLPGQPLTERPTERTDGIAARASRAPTPLRMTLARLATYGGTDGPSRSDSLVDLMRRRKLMTFEEELAYS